MDEMYVSMRLHNNSDIKNKERKGFTFSNC